MKIPVHRLSAIVFTDIEGYTSLMGKDEEKALHILQVNKEIHEENFRRFNCNFYKQMGDGFLAVFDSAVQAVYACGHILESCKANHINLRIGIHEGEVVFKENDVYGDEVNIASRIEQSAEPNSIYISDNVKRLVSNKPGLHTRYIREFDLKNVKDPVKIYGLEVDIDHINTPKLLKSTPITRARAKIGKQQTYFYLFGILIVLIAFYLIEDRFFTVIPVISDETRIEIAGEPLAILPFKNISRNPEMDYLGDGIADDIIIELSKIPELTVIARSSSFKYRDPEISLKRVSRELGVENVIEGGFQVVKTDVHISIQLVHCKSGNVILAESYEGKLDDIFGLQDKVASGIRNVLLGTLDITPHKAGKKDMIKLQAFRHYQAGLSLLKENYLSRNTILVSREQFRKAIAENPSWSAPYVAMAESFIMDIHYGYKIFIQHKDSLDYYTAKAIEINADPWEINYLKGVIAYFKFDFDKSKRLLNEAGVLNPNYPFIFYYLAWINILNSDYEEVISNVYKATSLDPLNEYIRLIGAMMISFTGNNEQAIKILTDMLEKDPGEFTTLFILGLIYSNMGEYEKALETLLQRNVGHHTNFMVAYNYAKTGQTDQARDILKNMLELPAENSPPPTHIAIVYLGLGEKEKAIDWLETAYEKYDAWLSHMDQSWFDPLRTDPRFIRIYQAVMMN